MSADRGALRTWLQEGAWEKQVDGKTLRLVVVQVDEVLGLLDVVERVNVGHIETTLRQHLPKDRYDENGDTIGTHCACGEWEGDYFADGEAGPFDTHLAAAIVEAIQ